MKRVINISGSALLIFVAVFCTLGALTSAFLLTVNVWRLLTIWLIYAVALAVIADLLRYKGILAALVPVILLFFWQWSEFMAGLEWTVYTITGIFSQWLPVRVLFPQIAENIEYYSYYHDYEFYINPTVFFLISGLVLSNALAATICMRRSMLLTMLCTAPFIILTLIITHVRSDTFFLFGLLAVYVTIFISSVFNPDSFEKRGLGFAPIFILALSLLGLTYLISAPDRHQRDTFAHTVNMRMNRIAFQLGLLWQGSPSGINFEFGWPAAGGFGGGVWQFNTNNVSIADAGARLLFDLDLLEVTVSEPGTFYIRGYTMSYFDGRGWHRNMPETPGGMAMPVIPENLEEAAMLMPASIASSFYSFSPLEYISDYTEEDEDGDGGAELLENPPVPATMTINRLGDVTNVDYKPYYTRFGHHGNHFEFYHVQDSIHMIDDAIQIVLEAFFDGQNPGPERTPTETDEVFRVEVFIDDDGTDMIWMETSIVGEFDEDELGIAVPNLPTVHMLGAYADLINRYDIYTSIDPDVAEALRDMAIEAGIDPYGDRALAADSVARYVRRSATYSLHPEITPDDEDFALHFLQTAESGFCIHFATAATMMLRALDIPARFTTGYVVNVSPDQTGQPIVITDSNAHAWVEVFYDGIGWLYLEVTPSTAYNIVPIATLHSPYSPSFYVNGGMFFPEYDFDMFMQNGWMNGGMYMNGYMNGQMNGQGGGSGIVTAETREVPGWVIAALITVISIVCISAIIARCIIVRNMRVKNFTGADTNFAVIYAWRYVIRFRRDGIIIPSSIEDIALKASFSQHRLSEDERDIVIKYVTKVANEIYKSSDNFKRLRLKYGRAVI